MMGNLIYMRVTHSAMVFKQQLCVWVVSQPQSQPLLQFTSRGKGYRTLAVLGGLGMNELMTRRGILTGRWG